MMQKDNAFRPLTPEDFAAGLLTLESPVVLMHARPDGDTVGTAGALCAALRALGKTPHYACPDPIPARLAFLLEGEEPAELPCGGDAVAVDVASPAQLGSLVGQVRPVLMLDHHEVGTPFADYYTVGGASSAGEVLANCLSHMEKSGLLHIDSRIASRLYAAIASDTGSFAYANTAPSTHRVAAKLMETGFDASEIHRRLFMTKTATQLRADGYVASHIETDADGKLAFVLITADDRAALGAQPQDFECAVDTVRSLAGVEIAAAVKEAEHGIYKVSLRSNGANVAEVAARFGGGGHIRAAGCTLTGETIRQAAEPLLAALCELI